MSIYLKKSIAAMVMAMSLGYAADSFANNSSTGPQVFDEMHISAWDNPYDVSNVAFNWTIDDYNAWDVGTSQESGGGNDYSPPPVSIRWRGLRRARVGAKRAVAPYVRHHSGLHLKRSRERAPAALGAGGLSDAAYG